MGGLKGMRVNFWRFLLIGILLSGCGLNIPELSASTPKPPISAPTISLSEIDPGANQVARIYLDAWKIEDYQAMYAMLTSISQDAISLDEFSRRYHNVVVEAALAPANGSFVDYQLLSSLTNPQSAQVGYRVILHSALVGDIQRDTYMNLSLEDGEWRVRWDDTLILPELAGGNYLEMEHRIPSRGNINDRNGRALVAQAAGVAIGVNTALLPLEQEDHLLELLEEMSAGQLRADYLRPRIDYYRSNKWYLPIADFSTDVVMPFDETLREIPGVLMNSFRSRYYFDGGTLSVAPHLTGYMSVITPEEKEYYQRLGYRSDERVGRDGLELWGESYLAGRRGGALYVNDPSGSRVTKLADRPTAPSQAIYTTVLKEFQEEVQKALNGFRGAVVVLERDTGRVLALASSPGFNPNLFEPANFNSELLIDTLYNEDTPLLNRATQGQYPLGSVFKIITMAAALESDSYSAESEYNCGYFFTEIPGVTLNDWTYEYFLADGRTQASGLLTLPQGLTRSCNPYFWHIALDFFNQGNTTAISDMAHGFGLGSESGIELSEAAGFIPVPQSQIDSTNFAIGQGGTLVTPLQVANFVAAIGNGGTLYRPQVIERIAPPDGDPGYIFTPAILGRLPVSAENLQSIHEAMVEVIGVQGTARSVGAYLNSYNIPAAGKTGTAQSGSDRPHAWFAGYTFAEREGQPDIAVAVVLENAGEGSVMAAPIFQGVVKLYFYGAPRNTFPWEVEPGVLRTPEPEPEAETTAEPSD